MHAMNLAPPAAPLRPASARWTPVALSLAVIAIASLPLWLAARWAPLASFALLTSGSLVWAAVNWRTDRRTARAEDAAGQGHETEPSADGALGALLTDVLPVWQSHVSQVKGQTEAAITQLALSFASITAQFEAAGFKGAGSTESPAHAGAYSLLTVCERELQPVIAVMTGILESKQLLMTVVHDLAVATAELRTMASEVSHIAWHTNLLAINAAVEAAHAGDSGRGFGVIAKEIRVLSQTSSAAGKRIATRMTDVERLMSAAIKVADETEEHDRVAIGMSSRVIEDVLGHVRELGEGADAMREQGNVIRADTENLLINLQFQDRVSQMITVIDNDIGRLQSSVQSGQAVPSAEAWLADLDRHYTMADQREPAGGAAAAESADDVLFF